MRIRLTIVIAITMLLAALVAPAYAQESANIITIPIHSEAYNFELSPDGRTVAVFEIGPIYNDAVMREFLPIRLYDTATGDLVAELEGHTDYATDVAFSPDSTQLVSIHFPGFMYVWDVASGEEIKRIDAVPGGSQIQYLPDGKSVVVLHALPYQPYFLIWEIDTSHVTNVLTQYYDFRDALQAFLDVQPFPDPLVTFDIAPDGTAIAVVFGMGKIERWDIDSGAATVLRPLTDERPSLNVRRIQFDAQGESVVFHDRSLEQIVMLDAHTGAEVTVFPAASRHFAPGPDNETLIQLLQDEDLNTWLEINSITDTAEMQRIDIDLPADLGRPVGMVSAVAAAADNAIVIGGFPSMGAPDQNMLLIITR